MGDSHFSIAPIRHPGLTFHMPASPVRIGITLGDPAGVGPEIVPAAMQAEPGPVYSVFGSGNGFTPGHPGLNSACAAFHALEFAVQALKRNEIDAVVTGPINKAWMYRVGFLWPGQTEYFAERFEIDNYAMLLTGKGLSVGLVTIHEPIVRVASLITSAEIVRVGKLMLEFLQFRVPHPRLAVAGLNPHAGESGNIGREEIEIIQPAITQLQREVPGATIAGPFAPDTVFHAAVEGNWDGVLCMYHDQGLIPLKLHAFHEGVNVTLGLPVIRTSPDHGTAFEIAGKGIARPESMIAAIRLARELVLARRKPA